MDNDQWEIAITVSGALQGEIMRGLLEAQGIEVRSLQESAGQIYGLGIGPTSEVQIMVRSEDLARAQQILEAYENGELENINFDQSDSFEQENPEDQG